MKIIIDENYLIETDRLNYILKRRCLSKKTGKEIGRVIGYYGSLDMLAERYLEERQKAAGNARTVNLDEYVRLVRESNKMAVSALYEVLRAYPEKG